MATTPTNITLRTCPRMLIQTGKTAVTEPEHLTTTIIDRDRPPQLPVPPIPQDGPRTNRPAKVLSGTGREGEEDGLPAGRRGHVRRAGSP